ncbi:MAG: nucleotidyl transferase AbiEii/AbiGii toxin family protein [Deltaproteobacteria bacterium]|nr:nucleotidyl transferase AbiEii/AbiGii toxin family protein [Deltaproteobacteria bacterium]
MRISQKKLSAIASGTGFRVDVVEKVAHLLNLLNTLNAHPYLKGKLALKGGTALNMFIFDIPRLSVDIDLNYVGATGREEMMAERPKIEEAMQAVFSREGFSVKRMPNEHAGGKWRLGYQSASGQSGVLEVDLNFMFRLPLWELAPTDSHPFGDFQARNFPVLDIHELAAGKLAALFARHQARDLFDVHQLLKDPSLDTKRLRVAFVTYGALNRRDWRTISLADINFDPDELKQMLLPVLRIESDSIRRDALGFTQHQLAECHEQLTVVLPFSKAELAFLDRILEKGEIAPELITRDTDLQKRIKRHPMLLWKAMNVRKHFGL